MSTLESGGTPPFTLDATEEDRLEGVLEDLQAKGLGLDLSDVLWLPGQDRKGKRAEVNGEFVLVYCQDLELAEQLVAHEVIHYEIARAVEPYVLALNAVLGVLGDIGQDRTERLTNRVTEVIND